jgi:hypothetical protein
MVHALDVKREAIAGSRLGAKWLVDLLEATAPKPAVEPGVEYVG